MNLYVNGVSVCSASSSVSSALDPIARKFRVGNNLGGTSPVIGNFSVIRFYTGTNSTLPLTNYNAEKDRF
jgi:hypothetical protein